MALDGGLDGLSEIRKVIKTSSELIKLNGKLILEIAHDQKKMVKKMLNDYGFYINKVAKDLANNNRCIVSTKIKIKIKWSHLEIITLEETILEEMIETSNLMEKDLNMLTTFQKMKIFKESYLVEIIITHQN